MSTSSATTRGISVDVASTYLPERSVPTGHRYAFAYTVTIRNEGSETAQLISRHWIITDSHGQEEEVRGEGVVGEQPVLEPGQEFEYTSWCVLKTPSGQMRGTYQMVTKQGADFDAEIATFRLVMPHSLN